MKILFFISLMIFNNLTSSAAYYETVPAGARMLLIRNVRTEDIKSSYNRTNIETPYTYEVEADIRTLEEIDLEGLQETLEFIKPLSPEAYEKITLGTHRISGTATVDATGYAFAYGITDTFMAYGIMPIMSAEVQMNYTRIKGSSEELVAEIYQSQIESDTAQTVGQIIDKLFTIDEMAIQSTITNTLHYNEIGDWSGEGLGDIEVGVMHNFFKTDTYGAKSSFGIVAPTGRVDDPDTLQDIGFGDGQWDVFMELGGGIKLSSQNTISSWGRFTYQFESKKTLRIPISKSVFISDTNGVFDEKLGNKVQVGLEVDHAINDWASFQIAYIYDEQGQTNYKSEHGDANGWLAANTDSNSHNVKVRSELSTVTLYKKGKFAAPGAISFAYQTMVNGKNIPKVSRFELEFRMFF